MVEAVLNSNINGSSEESDLPYEIKKAIIVYKGQLQAEYKYLNKLIKEDKPCKPTFY